MNRYTNIRCPKCGGKDDIVLVYSLGWAFRPVELFDCINGEVDFASDKYDTVDMTVENTPFGSPPASHLIHYKDRDQRNVCHRWTEEEEIQSHKTYERSVYWALREVLGIDRATTLAARHKPKLEEWEKRGLSAKRAALSIMAIEMGLPPEGSE